MAATIGRIRAEMDLPPHELGRWGPSWLQSTVVGPRVLGSPKETWTQLAARLSAEAPVAWGRVPAYAFWQ